MLRASEPLDDSQFESDYDADVGSKERVKSGILLNNDRTFTQFQRQPDSQVYQSINQQYNYTINMNYDQNNNANNRYSNGLKSLENEPNDIFDESNTDMMGDEANFANDFSTT